MTTDKNNFCHPGATAPGFKSAARLRGVREMLFLQVVSVVSKRTYRQPRLLRFAWECKYAHETTIYQLPTYRQS